MSDFVRLTEKRSVCPHCESSYKSLPRHWGHKPEHRPAMDRIQQAICAGLVLAKCKLDTDNQTPTLEIRTQYLGFAVWIHESLGWLSNSIYYSAPSTRQKNPTFIVRTVAHPGLRTFVHWRSGDQRPSPEQTLITRATVRAWVASAAGVGWSGTSKSRTTRFHAEESVTREWYQSILSHLGADARDTGRRLELTQADSNAVFDSIGPPVPGVRHKWAFEKPEYDEIRRTQWIDQQSIADGPFREEMLGRRPRAWKFKYRERDVLLALREAAGGDEITVSEYRNYRQTAASELPSTTWFSDRGGMSVWFALAGINRHRQRGYGLIDMVNAIAYVAETIDSWPTRREYHSHRRPSDPGSQWFYRNKPADLESWADLIERAQRDSDLGD